MPLIECKIRIYIKAVTFFRRLHCIYSTGLSLTPNYHQWFDIWNLKSFKSKFFLFQTNIVGNSTGRRNGRFSSLTRILSSPDRSQHCHKVKCLFKMSNKWEGFEYKELNLLLTFYVYLFIIHSNMLVNQLISFHR